MFQPLFIDGFAGGGGASTGIAQAIGREVDIAINHCPSAIAIHAANHPTTEHFCQDIRAVWPAHATRLRPVAGAWFSPDCKEFSKAKGGPVKNRHIRALSHEITVWLKQTRPVVAYVENVEEYQYAAPLDENGVPIASQKGKMFKALLRAWRAEGYRVKYRLLRACDYGAPTIRRRLYIIMRRDGLRIVWPKPTHGARESAGVLAGKLQPYRTAAECIDWSLRGRSIFDRDKDLAENTKRRVAHGVMRYVVNAARPFIVPVTHGKSPARTHDSAEPLRTITTANGGELAVIDAVLAPHVTKFHSGSIGSDAGDPMPTVTSNGNSARPAGAMPLGIVGATLIGTGYKNTRASRCFDPQDPLRTVTTQGEHAVAAVHMEPFMSRSGAGPADQPLRTVTGQAGHAAVETIMVPHVSTMRNAQKPYHAVGDPMPTVTADGGHQFAVSAFLSRFHQSNTNGGRGSADHPLGAVTAGGQHHSVVCAHLEQANGGPNNTTSAGHDPRKPMSTVTTTGSQQRVVQTVLIDPESMEPETLRKANLCAAFLVKYFGTAVGQPVDEPFATVTTLPRFAVVTVEIDSQTYVLVDITLRMLTPRELARAQGFPDDYVLDPITPQVIRGKVVHKPLTIAAQIRMIGNSVCPPVARALVAANHPFEQEGRMAA